MSATENRSAKSVQVILDRLCQNPIQLRVVLALGLAVGWYLAIYRPVVGRVESTRKNLDVEQKRLALAEEIEVLQAEVKRYSEHLPPRPDPNEAVQYILQGVRAMPVRLESIDPGTVTELGPYKGVTVRLVAQGSYQDLDRMLRWVESNGRMVRVEEIAIEPLEERTALRATRNPREQARQAAAASAPRTEPQYTMTLVILGVIG